MLETLAMVLCMTILGIAGATITFRAATREDGPAAEPAPEPKAIPTAAPERFFVNQMPVAAAPQARVPIEALLLQIERHIRLEQAAAESFLDSPTPQSLHRPTASPLLYN